MRALEQQMGSPDFWEDSERAAAVSGEHARATRRLESFLELAAMLEASPTRDLPADMSATMRTKTLLLAWAFDERYGYLSRLARGETQAVEN